MHNKYNIPVDTSARKANRRPTLHQIEITAKDGVCDTIEGPVEYQSGDAIVQGIAGEKWPVASERFSELYEPVGEQVIGSGGLYRRRSTTVWAKQMESEFTVTLHPSQATIRGSAGDWLIQYAEGDHACVKADIFSAIYELID